MIHLSLSQRIASIAFVAVVGMAMVTGIFMWNNSVAEDFARMKADGEKVSNLVTVIDGDFLKARSLEKDFLLRNDPKYANGIKDLSTAIQSNIKLLTPLLTGQYAELATKLEILDKQFSAYGAKIGELEEIHALLGYDPDSGVQGKLREAAHALEESFKSNSNADLTVSLLMMRRHEKDFMLRLDGKYVDKLDQEVKQMLARSADQFGGPAARDASFKTLKGYQSDFAEFARMTLAERELRGAVSSLFAPLEPLFQEMHDSVEAIGQTNTAERIIKSRRAEVIALGATGGIIVLIAGMVLIVGRSISGPINASVAAMSALAQGNDEITIPGLSRRDEIGKIAAAIEVFRNSSIAKKDMERQAADNRRMAEQQRIRDREQVEADAERRLNEATSGLATGLQRLATGDLMVQITVPFAPEFEALRDNFNTSVAQLANTLGEISISVETINVGTGEISQGAHDLSQRTERQAAALEETAAALDQITANVQSSSKRADEARHVSVQATTSATRSGEVVNEAVNAMSRIEESARQISNIIGVIDQIAFQTNLLALNAGVEAARAGDAGKGFAVVAQEVRELAQRSASAAKEIGALIQTSASEVATGVKLVSDTGGELKSISAFILTINQHMDAIATAAREQSLGLAEVNTAVNQMDQVTQQNAAMVEESSAASSSLADECTTLRRLVTQFKIGENPLSRRPAADGRRQAA
ncbi:MAG: methyl-accepting chemotaxis protein [Allorhizobium sp.]